MTARYQLPGELTIYSAMETRDSLLAWIAAQSAKSGHTLEVSAADVQEIDGAGLQLLAALSHADLPWRLLDPSDALVGACSSLGLTDWLNQVSAASEGVAP